MSTTLRLILGDQLNSQHPWLENIDPSVTYVMMEMRQETDYVVHHLQKIVGFFLAMRQFAKQLQEQGHQVIYYCLDDPENRQDLSSQIQYLIQKESFSTFEYQYPDEYRLEQQLQSICQELDIPSHAVDSHHFLTSRGFLKDFFKGKKSYLMETFYREMRRKYQVLMVGNEPLGGQWNFDQENRKPLKEKGLLQAPGLHPKSVGNILDQLSRAGVKTLGSLDPEAFAWPSSRKESLDLLHHFCRHLLPNFGTYQDAMTTWDPYLFHSRLSFSLNCKMISPLEVVQAAEKAWSTQQDKISLAQVEGFIRQILGWREYMRGIYWAEMPRFATLNYFGHERNLPSWFWTGKTKMNCLNHSITQSLTHAYAHHIQRLMVTGNFALLAGIHPDEVDAWYLGIYIDAIQWVEITNTRGMSQFADGGIVGTKPYTSSANYIKKQGNYCSTCAYDADKKVGDRACPFNSLYWHFHVRHREKLEKNPRIGMVYRTWDKMTAKQEVLEQAESYLQRLEEL
ncbi:MAG: cryptochrome/photolyase family protein [Bacteroidetes bacterium]|nr:cryptochrome/photolyase family protein [Bacteroidota bacterium]